MPWFSGGGSGGLTSVTTDGVTIQGNGTGGSPVAIKAVQTDASLTGAGTVASTLKVPPLTFFKLSAPTQLIGGPSSGGQIYLSGFVLPYPLTFANIIIDVGTADNANNNDIGVYTAAGALVANIGGQHIASTGVQSFATLQGSQTIFPGKYLFAVTSAATTLKVGFSNTEYGWFESTAFGSGTGGTLPGSISAPSQAVNTNIAFFILTA